MSATAATHDLTIDPDAVLRAYIIAALWSETDVTEAGGDPLDVHYGPDDLAPSARAACERDVASFLAVLAEVDVADRAAALMSDAHLGHDFLLTRNGHGAGFWDRGNGAVGDILTTWAHTFGEACFYVGDDKMIYVSGDETYAGEVSA
mgnify:CR=1 FL=1